MVKCKFHAPAIFLFREFRFFDVQTRSERVFALLVSMFVSILVEHGNLGSQGFLEKKKREKHINYQFFIINYS